VATNNDLLIAAEAAATRAAEFIRGAERPSDPATWGVKGVSDFVTNIDRNAEAMIADTLLERFPGSTVLGEELTPGATAADLVWIVDPLDGTTNYLHRYPAYAVSVAAMHGGDLVAGVVIDVPANRMYKGAVGRGASCDGTPLRVSETVEAASALIGTGYPFKSLNLLPRYLEQFTRVLRNTSGIRRAGSAALDLAHVAAGFFEGFWELQLAPWDVAAGAVLVREAGGVITNLEGDSNVARHGSIVAGNEAIHRWLMNALTTT
jgi:myo-inositol-1(or 4)-monophosphatase